MRDKRKENKILRKKNFGEESIGGASGRGRARGNHYGDDVSTQFSIVSSSFPDRSRRRIAYISIVFGFWREATTFLILSPRSSVLDPAATWPLVADDLARPSVAGRVVGTRIGDRGRGRRAKE